MADVAAIQRALSARGHNPGPPDGIWGRRTIAAVKAFQRAAKLVVDGVIGPKTLDALGLSPMREPVWLTAARRAMGLHEVRDRSKLMAWLCQDGKTLGDPSKLPWCGDFVQTPIAVTLPAEILPVNPYWARSWEKFGTALRAPALGAVLVFTRPNGGHVGFYVGERTDAYRVLGGNQSNAVTEAWIAKSRCTAIRWPETAPLPTTGRVMLTAAGALSTNEA